MKKINFLLLTVSLILDVFLSINISNAANITKQIQRWQTKNGSKIIFYQTMAVPILDIKIAFAAGGAYDGNYPGLSYLTTELLAEGTHSVNADMIAEQLTEVGAQYDHIVMKDKVVLSLKSLINTDKLTKSVKLFTKIISRPDFPEDAFIRKKNQQLIKIKQANDSPEEIAKQTFFKYLYKNHPYAHPLEGDEATLSTIDIITVKNFYRRYFVSNNASISIVGAISLAKAHDIAEALTKNLSTGTKAIDIPNANILPAAQEVIIKYPSTQTMLITGQIGIDYQNPNYFPLLVGNYILGGSSLVSKLFLAVRENKGFTYGITSNLLPLPGKGPFMISLSTKNSSAYDALKLTQKILTKFYNDGPTEEEIIFAKKYLIGNFPLMLDSNENISNVLLNLSFYDLPQDYLATYTDKIYQVTKEQVKSAFTHLLNLKKLLVVIVGELPPLREQKSKN